MSLAFTATATLTSSTMRGACVDMPNNLALIVEATTPSFRKFNIATGAQVGTNTAVASNPAGIALIDGLSAVVPNGSTTTWDLIEVSSGYRTTITGGITVGTGTRDQRIASDLDNNVVFAVSGTVNGTAAVLKKATLAITTTTALGAARSNTYIPRCVIYKGGGRFLVGFSSGDIIEVDSNFVVYNHLAVTYPTVGPGVTVATSYAQSPDIVQLAYANDIIMATTDLGQILIYEFSTKKFLKAQMGAMTQEYHISNTNAGTLLGAQGVSSANQVVVELDLEIRPVHVEGYLFTNATNTIGGLWINTTNNNFFCWSNNDEKIHFGVQTPRGSVTRTLTLPNATDEARLVAREGSTTGTAKVLVDRYVKSGQVYRVPTGKTIFEMIQIGEGEDAGFNSSSYST